MTNEEQLQIFREQHVLTALKEIPGARWWALTRKTPEATAALDALAYFGIAWTEDRVENGLRFSPTEFKAVLAELMELNPSLKQQRPNEPSPLPELWRNPLTGEPLPPPKGLDEEGVLEKRSPELLKLLQGLEKMPWATVARLQDEAAKRARIAAIKYASPEDATNPVVTGDLPGQTQLAKENPELFEFYKSEARPAVVPWQPGQPKTSKLMGDLTQKAPHLAKIANRAKELHRQQLALKVAEAKAAEAAAQQARQQAEAMLK
jgi:hypothetical protein